MKILCQWTLNVPYTDVAHALPQGSLQQEMAVHCDASIRSKQHHMHGPLCLCCAAYGQPALDVRERLCCNTA